MGGGRSILSVREVSDRVSLPLSIHTVSILCANGLIIWIDLMLSRVTPSLLACATWPLMQVLSFSSLSKKYSHTHTLSLSLPPQRPQSLLFLFLEGRDQLDLYFVTFFTEYLLIIHLMTIRSKWNGNKSNQ